MKRATGLASLAVFTLVTSVAVAEDKDADAERLFKEGQKLMEERRFGEACPKLEAAYKKDLQLGTLLNLGYCHKEQGALWVAWLEFKEAELKAIEVKRSDRREFARQRMAELERSLAKAAVDPTTKVELTEVVVEDRVVPDAEKGASFAIEPGQRKFTFKARGKKPAVVLVSISKTERAQRVVVPDMEDQPKDAPAAPSSATTPAAVGADAKTPAKGSFPFDSPQRTGAVVAAGVGAVGLVVGSIFGVMTFGNGCAPPKAPGSCQPGDRDSGSNAATISTIGFVVAGAAIATAAVLWFTAPSAPNTASRVPSLHW